MAATQQVLLSAKRNLFVPTTLNSADKSGNLNLSNGNLSFDANIPWQSVRTIASRSTGKYRAEMIFDQLGAGFSNFFGVCRSTAALTNFIGSDADGWGIQGAPCRTFLAGGGVSNANTALSVGERVACYIDLDAGKGWFWTTDHGFIGGGNPATGTSPTFTFTANSTLFFGGSGGFTNEDSTCNFGATALTSPAAAGFIDGFG